MFRIFQVDRVIHKFITSATDLLAALKGSESNDKADFHSVHFVDGHAHFELFGNMTRTRDRTKRRSSS